MVSSANQSNRCKIYREKKKQMLEKQAIKIQNLKQQVEILKENVEFECKEAKRVMAKYKILEHDYKLYRLYHGKWQYDQTHKEIVEKLEIPKQNNDA